MNTVKANNVIIEIYDGSAYYPVFCGKTMEFSQSQELVEITSVNSAVAREYQAGLTTATLNITGVTVLDNTDGRLAGPYLMQVSIRRTEKTCRIRLTDDDGGTLEINFTALITNNTLARSVGQYAQSTVSLTVTGEITVQAVAPPPTAEIVYSDWWVMTAGATSISGASSQHGYSLINKTLLEVDREGTNFDIITSGSPGNRQAKHDDVAGSISFDPTNPSLGETVFVLFKT